MLAALRRRAPSRLELRGPTVGVDNDGRLAYQSLGASEPTEAGMFDDPGNGQARPGDVDAVLTGDRFRMSGERAVTRRSGVYALDGESLDLVEVASGRGDDGEHS